LIEEKGFTIVAAEADWPDAARIDHYVRHRETPPSEWQALPASPRGCGATRWSAPLPIGCTSGTHHVLR
jgi:erythromycin esterase-like protein